MRYPYTITESLAGLEQSRYRARSWRSACALASVALEYRLAELERLLSSRGDTPTLQSARGECRRALEYFTGAARDYRLPAPILPGGMSETSADPWRLTITRGR